MLQYGGFFLFVTLILSGCDKQEVLHEQVAANDYFPVIDFVDLEGRVTPFSEFQGKLVVLNIWATWCPPCRRELPSLEQLGQALDGSRFSVILLSVDSDEHVVREYLIDVGLEPNTFIDKELEISGKVLGAISYPVTYLVSPQGKVMQVVYGEQEWDNVVIIEKLEHAFKSGTISI